jgi:uncharacterized membrane protein HdeD (DUF308 family)
MVDRLSSAWWILAIRGAAAIVFGVLALVWPGITILALVIVFGAYAIVDGVFALVGAIRGVPGESRPWLALVGVLGIVAGILVFVWPGITTLVLLMLIAAWFVVTGIFEIVAAIRLRAVLENEWMTVVSGVLSVVFGILLFIWPVRGAIALAWLIGVFAIVYGAALLVAAFRMRGLTSGPTTHGGTAPAM